MPPVPKWLFAPAGPVRVRFVRNLKHPDTGQLLFGLWDLETRTISLDKDLGLLAARQTMYHEQFHAWIDDLGVVLTSAVLERLCDGYALGRMGETRWNKK